MTKTSDKAIAASVPLFTAWCATYAWPWLAGLEAVFAAGFLSWKVSNVGTDEPLVIPSERIPVDAWGPAPD